MIFRLWQSWLGSFPRDFFPFSEGLTIFLFKRWPCWNKNPMMLLLGYMPTKLWCYCCWTWKRITKRNSPRRYGTRNVKAEFLANANLFLMLFRIFVLLDVLIFTILIRKSKFATCPNNLNGQSFRKSVYLKWMEIYVKLHSLNLLLRYRRFFFYL